MKQGINQNFLPNFNRPASLQNVEEISGKKMHYTPQTSSKFMNSFEKSDSYNEMKSPFSENRFNVSRHSSILPKIRSSNSLHEQLLGKDSVEAINDPKDLAKYMKKSDFDYIRPLRKDPKELKGR